MKRQHQSNPTHIDRLPKDLVHNILMRLPIQDEVRTSILSGKWRYIWTELPQLVFDDKFCEESILKKNWKLKNAINQVILLHQGPLTKFELSVSHLKSSWSEIDQFVLVILRKGVKDLSLRFQEDEPYTLPSSVFAYSQQLERLQLQHCILKPPSGFNGFSKVINMDLSHVCGVTGNRLSSIISHCPFLETLIFTSSERCARIDIDAPNLLYLSICSPFQPLCFINTPKLAKVDIYSYSMPLSQSMLCGRLPVVEELALDDVCLEYVTTNRTSGSLAGDLCRLKSLYLFDICLGTINDYDELSAAICLIRNSPELEKLAIYVLTYDTVSKIEFAEAENVRLDHLKRVELRNVSGSKGELQFIKFILAKSPVLEKFLIIPDSDLVGEEGLKFFKELSRFRRASPLVEIDYEG